MSDDFSAMFTSLNASLQRMEEKIAGVAADMDKLKKDPKGRHSHLGLGTLA